MAVDIDELQIEIQSSATSAVSNVDALTDSLVRLRSSAKGGAGLTATVNQIKALASASASLNSVNIDGGKFQQIASALSSLSNIEKATGLTSTINALKKLPAITDSLKTMNIAEFATQITRAADAVRPLAAEMQKVSAGFAAFPIRIQKIISSNAGLAASNHSAGNSFGFLGKMSLASLAKMSLFGVGIRQVVLFFSEAVTSINEYVENVNLFQVAMGDFYQEAFDYAQLVSEKLGVDPSEWMRNQGVFMSMANGFGMAKEKAYALSEGLTELSYDIASLYNEDIAKGAQRLQSALAGEIEPIRRLGISISQATLQEFAFSRGIDETVIKMTEQEKALLRSLALMDGAARIGAIGDFAKTLESPANSMRVLNQQMTQFKRAIGSVLLPAIVQLLPYIQAIVSLFTDWIKTLAIFAGFVMPEWEPNDWSSGITTGANDSTDAVNGATKAVKELKNATLGIDELNVISPNTAGGASGASGGTSGWADDLEIPDLWDKDALKEIQTQADTLKETLKPILKNVGLIAAGFLAWKITTGLLKGLETIKSLSSKNLSFGIEFKVLGLAMFLADISEFLQYFKDFKQNGATFHNVAGMISEFSGMVGDALIILGSLKLGGALKLIQGVGEIVVAIEDISNNGVNWENAFTAIRGLTNIAIGIGLFTGSIKLAAWGVAIQGFTSIIGELGENWGAIKQGDWSGVDKVTLIIGGLEILGGLVVALDVFSKLKGIADIGKSAEAVKTVSTTTQTLDTTVSKSLSPNLTSLAKNLGLGLVIVAEVATAALLMVGAIALMGRELELVGKAWKPVIENGETIAVAIGIGTGILVAVGIAAYALGTLGTPAATNIGIGTGILAELGIATGLFIIEIWAIGKGLDEIGKAWQPVLDNGETIAKGVGLGTALLVGVGVVTAALGVATVASAGLLPLAIGLGTAILAELAASFVLFTKSLVDVADEMGNNLYPSLDKLNKKLPSIKSNMSSFTDYMTEFSGEVVSYTKSMGGVTWSGIVGGFQKLFAGRPIKSLSDDVSGIADDTSVLNGKLELANPELETAIDFLTDYSVLMSQIKTLTEKNGDISLATGMFTNLKVAGGKLVTGFSAGVNESAHIAIEAMSGLFGSAAYGDGIIGTVTETLKISDKSDSKAFFDIGEKLVKGLSMGIEENINLVKIAMNTLLNPMLLKMETFSNRCRSALNDMLIDCSSSMGSVKLSADGKVSYNPIKRVHIPSFATGGFPEQGQYFRARENGPEMVGTIGNRTAVANNDQIVDGISGGVAEGNIDLINAVYAMASRIVKAVEEKDSNVYLDKVRLSRALAPEQKRRERETGRSFVTGGAL